MKELTAQQIANLATAVRLFFSCEHFEIEDIVELTFAYCLRKNLIDDKSEEWVYQLIDGMNGGGYNDPEKCYNDLYRDYINDYNTKNHLHEAEEFNL